MAELARATTDMSKSRLVELARAASERVERAKASMARAREKSTRAARSVASGLAVVSGGAAHGALEVYMPHLGQSQVKTATALAVGTIAGSAFGMFGELDTYAGLFGWGLAAGESSRFAERSLLARRG